MVMASRQVGTDRDRFGALQNPCGTVLLREILEDRLKPIADALLDPEQTLGDLVRIFCGVRDAAQVTAAPVVEV